VGIVLLLFLARLLPLITDSNRNHAPEASASRRSRSISSSKRAIQPSHRFAERRFSPVRRKVNFPRDTLAIESRDPRVGGTVMLVIPRKRHRLRDVRPVTRTKKMNDRVTERAMSLRTARIFSRGARRGNETGARTHVDNNRFSLLGRVALTR